MPVLSLPRSYKSLTKVLLFTCICCPRATNNNQSKRDKRRERERENDAHGCRWVVGYPVRREVLLHPLPGVDGALVHLLHRAALPLVDVALDLLTLFHLTHMDQDFLQERDRGGFNQEKQNKKQKSILTDRPSLFPPARKDA